jgi:hypothetical protein
MDRSDVIGLEIWIIGKNVGFRGFPAEEFEKEFNGVSEAANAGLAVADVRG